MARQRKPLALHLLENTHRPDRHGPREAVQPPAPGGPGRPPPHMTPHAQRAWRELCRAGKAWLGPEDRPLLEVAAMISGEVRADPVAAVAAKLSVLAVVLT